MCVCACVCVCVCVCVRVAEIKYGSLRELHQEVVVVSKTLSRAVHSVRKCLVMNHKTIKLPTKISCFSFKLPRLPLKRKNGLYASSKVTSRKRQTDKFRLV